MLQFLLSDRAEFREFECLSTILIKRKLTETKKKKTKRKLTTFKPFILIEFEEFWCLFKLNTC